MNIQTITYEEYLKEIPTEGRHILAQQTGEQILVYQAYNNAIADFAVKNQYFGGNSFSYLRMSWIKPNFLWMMYRCGWAVKANQERVLGIWIDKKDFEFILNQSAFTSYKEDIYGNRENWKQALSKNPVRLQWDPDHDIYGNKQERKAIQLGLKGNILKQFGTEMIKEIIDLTAFVKEQKQKIDDKKVDDLLVPQEQIFQIKSKELNEQIGLKHI